MQREGVKPAEENGERTIESQMRMTSTLCDWAANLREDVIANYTWEDVGNMSE